MEQEETTYDGGNSEGEATYLGDRLSEGGGCETSLTVRTRCGRAKFRECEGNIGAVVEQEETTCDEVETVRGKLHISVTD